ncbi:D-glycerate dehydrogenase [candidate division KSB1 bacterium]|nr:D-glycerate dehydrogenase [candidate division KSB1 bacterium]NIR70287.1 D-glycerate dehydrogenase [candidate division KSB1 bacterium]NIS24448.1 D-glycerate dehydrogenase [candidate division KSB1 bacterium]NIT71383.1 D-glycerate dehydrogenase [candidate division KSB1 bacterium]NIU25068.1 D-glycerate dehydrogenase [candidate division KSB1 bacterium]
MAKDDFNVYVTRIIPEPGLEILRKNIGDVEINTNDHILSQDELLEKVKGRDALLPLLTDTIDGDVMDAAGEQLKIIANHAVGFDNIDVEAATKRGIMVTNTPGVLTEATSDHAWALLFASARRIVESDKFARAGKFTGWGPMMFLGGDITDRTLGIVGAGRIGSAVAEKARGFRMRVLYSDQVANSTLEKEVGARKVPFEELLKESDFVSVHVPLLDSTHHLFDDNAFKLMKKSAYLINTSRGPVVDEAALVRALKEGEIAGAGIDVFEEEPKIHPELIHLENVTITPHIASATIETRTKMATMAAQNLVDGLRGKRPTNLVNPEVWKD